MRRFAALGVVTMALFTGAGTLATNALAADPTVSTGTTTNVTDTRATLNGTVNAQGQAVNYAFQYGPTTDYGQQTRLVLVDAETVDRAVSAEVDELTPGTDYHVRVFATNASGVTVVGNDQTFRTTGTAPVPAPKPTVSTGSAVASLSTATVTGTVNPQGRPTTYYFEFGETTNYGQQTSPQSAGQGATPVTVQAALSNLRTDATYHYRVVAVGPDNAIATGEDRTFTTGGSASTMLSFFGHTSFTDQNGVGGVFLGCFGAVACRGDMTLSRSGKLLGERKGYTVRANNGGIVHITLNDLGKRLLRQRGNMNVRTNVVNANGQRVDGVTRLIRYATTGLKG